MKNAFKLLRLAIVIAVCCVASVVATLELFDLHPEIHVGHFHSIWVGLKHMDLETGTGTVLYTDGRKELCHDYDLGPIKVTIARML